jgi:hypothetical protein
MSKHQAPATKYGMYAAYCVLVVGFISGIIRHGLQVLTDTAFWFGLYGWLAAAIVIGYLVYLGWQIFGRRTVDEPQESESPEKVSTMGARVRMPREANAIATSSVGATVEAGLLPAWEMADLPNPPRFNLSNALTIVGPGAILLGISIGSGEWLLGPAVTAQYSGSLLWLATASIVLQVMMNTEFIRYTMYTGEPIYTGFMRTKPGASFWALVYSVLAFLQLGWPGWASAAATALTALIIGDMPGPEHANLIKLIGLFWFLSTVAIVAFGAKIEQTMELVQWFFVAAILLFLLVIGVVFVSPATWVRVANGFVSFSGVPEKVDWSLVGGFAADAGAGGVLNGTISNWFRDKGFGMGGVVGYIPAIIGGRKVPLTHAGKVFPLTAENKRRWREWWKFAAVDQYGLWAVGCFLGVGLPALLTLQFIPAGTEFKNEFGIAVYQAKYLSWAVGSDFMWFVTLLVGFWILYSTQLGITDAFARTVTDIIWSGSRHARAWRSGDIRFVYYSVLSLFTVWGVFILLSGLKPLLLVLLGANMAGLNFVFLGLHTLYVNRKFLPADLRPPRWREVIVLLAVVFFAFFFFQAVPDMIKQIAVA